MWCEERGRGKEWMRGRKRGNDTARRCLEEDRLRFSSSSGKEKMQRRYMRGG